jgi:hypothetical protein
MNFEAYAYDFQITKPPDVITNIPGLIGWAIQILFLVAGLVAFVYLLLGGIKWITSGGDKGQVEAARSQIIQALIGLIIVFAAWGIIVLVENLTGIGLGFGKEMTLPGSDTLRTPCVPVPPATGC